MSTLGGINTGVSFAPKEKSSRQIAREEIKRQQELEKLEEKNAAGEISKLEYNVGKVVLNMPPIEGPIVGQEKTPRQIAREEIKRQQELDELEEKYAAGEISKLKYTVSKAILNMNPIEGPIVGQEKTPRQIAREEIKKQQELDKLEEKYQAGEISKLEYNIGKAVLNMPALGEEIGNKPPVCSYVA